MESRRRRLNYKWIIGHKYQVVASILIVATLLFYGYFVSPPENFIVGEVIEIEDGTTVTEAALFLKGNNFIRSPLLFKIIVRLISGGRGILMGEYVFSRPRSVIRVAMALTDNTYRGRLVKVRIPDGAGNQAVGSILSKAIKDFDIDNFLSLVGDKEGFLFPDTYFFAPNVSESDIASHLLDNFEKKTAPLSEDISESGFSLKEILTMASLIEKEAGDFKSKKMISGILWRRIKIGMPLQVDAVFPYIMGKNTFQLTLDDLKVESPYNTYKYKGLPPGPIANPGLDSIVATLHPTESDFLFYLSDMDGNIHYAEDFEQHKINKTLYLR